MCVSFLTTLLQLFMSESLKRNREEAGLSSSSSSSRSSSPQRKQPRMDVPATGAPTEDREFDNEYSRLIHAIGSLFFFSLFALGIFFCLTIHPKTLFSLGKDTLLKMKNYKILLCGLAGVGLEVAKNLLLTGVKSLTICDDAAVTSFDLSTNFYLTVLSLSLFFFFFFFPFLSSILFFLFSFLFEIY